MEGIEAEELTRAAHLVANRDRLLLQQHAQPAVACKLIEARRQTAARGIPHPAQGRADRVEERRRELIYRPRVGSQLRREIDVAARQQHRDAVIADVPGDENPIASADRAR